MKTAIQKLGKAPGYTAGRVRDKAPIVLAARRRLNELAGHLWTVVPSLLSVVRHSPQPRARRFQTVMSDPIVGSVKLTGLLSEVAGSETIVVIVHGLSGNAESPYCVNAARAAERAGFSTLRISLRGADYSGEDILHGGITEDVWAALRAPEIARYRDVLLLGYSVGGHVVLRAAVEQLDRRVRAAAAICPPLDLDHATIAFDHPARMPYRRSTDHLRRDRQRFDREDQFLTQSQQHIGLK